MALYTETVMDHFMHPRNVGEIADADGVGEVGNAKCGDIMKMYLKIKDDKIEDVKFETFGCGSAIASRVFRHTIGYHTAQPSCMNSLLNSKRPPSVRDSGQFFRSQTIRQDSQLSQSGNLLLS